MEGDNCASKAMTQPANSEAPEVKPPKNDAEISYTLPMRIFGGMTWGTILSLTVGLMLVLIPQIPRPGWWAAPVVWLFWSGLGIALQWKVARGPCPKCGFVQIVPPQGKRCPECRSYLKAVDRQVIKF